MNIQGIGVISKKEVMRILTSDGKEAVKNGEITTGELAGMYKLEQVKRRALLVDMETLSQPIIAASRMI